MFFIYQEVEIEQGHQAGKLLYALSIPFMQLQDIEASKKMSLTSVDVSACRHIN
jgi:hypothetical protein